MADSAGKIYNCITTLLIISVVFFDSNVKIVQLLQKASIRLDLRTGNLHYPYNARSEVPCAAWCKFHAKSVCVELRTSNPGRSSAKLTLQHHGCKYCCRP